MNERLEGFGERVKRLNPLWQLGRGMQLGSLGEYAQMVILALFLEIFYRELDGNLNRSRQDLIEIVTYLLKDLGLLELVEQDQIERLVDGVLWSGSSEFQQPFTSIYFNEKKETMDTHTFRYLKEDRNASEWEKGGRTVYQLSDESLEILFMSREILQELEIGIEQLYVQQLIKRGNFHKAKQRLDDLLARVKRLIQSERNYQVDIRRNPKLIFQQGTNLRNNREKEIKAQFQEEKARFDELTYTLNRHQSAHTEEHRRLFEKIEQTRQMHDQLAKVVLENMALELELRVKYPHLFWKRSRVNFRQHIFEDILLKKGLPHPEQMEAILMPLFSVHPDFIFPLDWAWEEQHSENMEEAQEEEVEQEEAEEIYQQRIVDWEPIVDLWQPIIDLLMEDRSFSLSTLRHLPNEEQERWLQQKEAIDLWILFYNKALTITDLGSQPNEHDERIVLLNHLVKRDAKYRTLEGKRLYAEIEPETEMIRWKGLVITPFQLILEEGIER